MTRAERKRRAIHSRVKKGPLTIEDIFTDPVLYTIWRHLVTREPVSKSMQETGKCENSVLDIRKKIRSAISNDPEIKASFRKEINFLFPHAKEGLVKALSAGDASALNGYFRGMGIYRYEDTMDVTVQSPEELEKRRLARLEVGAGKVKR
jgi:hypothetical protein